MLTGRPLPLSGPPPERETIARAGTTHVRHVPTGAWIVGVPRLADPSSREPTLIRSITITVRMGKQEKALSVPVCSGTSERKLRDYPIPKVNPTRTLSIGLLITLSCRSNAA
jgi:hypothetical protein